MMEWLNHFVVVSIVILAVILLRQFCGNRISPLLRCCLWLVVALKLFIPVTFLEVGPGLNQMVERNTVQLLSLLEDSIKTPLTHSISLEPTAVLSNITAERKPSNTQNQQPSESWANTAAAQTDTVDNLYSLDLPTTANSENLDIAHSLQPDPLLFLIWLTGALLLATVLIGCNIHFYLRLKKTRQIVPTEHIPLTVYLSDCIQTPCLFGIFRPAVYLTPECLRDDKMKQQILTHELMHYTQKDHLWNLLSSLSLILYWYHPLVWLAAKLSAADRELACDFRTIQLLGEKNRADYGRTLIRISCEVSEKTAPFLLTTGIASTTRELKKRLNFLANRPRKRLSTALLATTVSLCLTGFIFSSDTHAKLMEAAQYPLDATAVHDAIRESRLAWEITYASDSEDQRTSYTLRDRFDKMIAAVICQGNRYWMLGTDPETRILSMSFMHVNPLTYDSLAPLSSQPCAPLLEKDFEAVLRLAALLYGGLESPEQLIEAYHADFAENMEITTTDYAVWFGSKQLIYSEVGRWIWKYEDITLEMKVGWPEDYDQMVMLSLRLYNTSYDPYAEPMNVNTTFSPDPEFTITEIDEQSFLTNYRKYHSDASSEFASADYTFDQQLDESTDFMYDREPGDCKFYEILLRDSTYCPEYPLDLKLYLAINLSLDVNNADYAVTAHYGQPGYSFDLESISGSFSVRNTSDDGKEIQSGLIVPTLILTNESGEITELRQYGYNTTFEIEISKEMLSSQE